MSSLSPSQHSATHPATIHRFEVRIDRPAAAPRTHPLKHRPDPTENASTKRNADGAAVRGDDQVAWIIEFGERCAHSDPSDAASIAGATE